MAIFTIIKPARRVFILFKMQLFLKSALRSCLNLGHYSSCKTHPPLPSRTHPYSVPSLRLVIYCSVGFFLLGLFPPPRRLDPGGLFMCLALTSSVSPIRGYFLLGADSHVYSIVSVDKALGLPSVAPNHSSGHLPLPTYSSLFHPASRWS
jgi:hypothetical protein